MYVERRSIKLIERFNKGEEIDREAVKFRYFA